MFKKTISIGLALIMALCLLTVAASGANNDGLASWAVPEVDRAKELGLVPQELQSKYAEPSVTCNA